MHIEAMDANEEFKDDEYDDDKEEEEEEEEVHAARGYVVKAQNDWVLLRHMFPCRAGGVPVYAPIIEKDSTFHRTLFVFMCLSMTCLRSDQHERKCGREKQSRSVKVFRCQLPRVNAFYDCEPPKDDGSSKPKANGAPLCTWCGTWKGVKICGCCRKARYCSQKHQVMHWREGHKPECHKFSASQSSRSSDQNIIDGRSSREMPKVASKTLWPEFKIVPDSESDGSTSFDDAHSNSSVITQEMDGTSESMLESYEGDGDDDKRKSGAILRYSRDERAEPLWREKSSRSSKADIPNCSYCHGPMNFEFQIMPQLLYYLRVKNEVESLDWATIVVYTCADSCVSSLSYKQEFAWVQLYS
ncbi:hypothetical protein RND81_01G128800 [Saponaria officinalis]|uniref:MYND-type domain-containing protein n=1 Tax=Saponaria officinalis TaxID=3572 RepID=A0AAW1NIF9_SAPOF